MSSDGGPTVSLAQWVMTGQVSMTRGRQAADVAQVEWKGQRNERWFVYCWSTK
jgi:hypothetical protein